VSDRPVRLDRLTAGDLPVVVGDFRLVVPLGERGEGRVFRAEGPGGVTEITALWPSLLAAPEANERVAAELARATALRAPGVVAVQQVGEQRRGLWFASAPHTGVTLAELVGGEVAASPPQVLEAMAQVLDTLEQAHGLAGGAVLHAGLTPERILVGTGGRVVLRGFGLGGLPLTTGGGGGSTPGDWASPEQVGRRALVPASDLFAVGAIVYFGLTGKLPFRASPGAKPSERVGEIVRVLARGDLFRRVERLALGLGTTLQGFLAVDPGSRYASAGQAAEALRAVAGRMPRAESLATLVSRVLVDHAQTVAAPEGRWPTSRDLRPLDSLVPRELRGEETADTDADFLLPSQRLARQKAREAEELTTEPGRGRVDVPLVSRDSKRTHVVSRDAIPAADEATVAGPGPAPRVGAASLGAPRPAPVPAPRVGAASTGAPRPPSVPVPQREPVPAPRVGAASTGAPRPAPVPVPRREPVPAPRIQAGPPQPPAEPPPMPAVGPPRGVPPGWTPPGARSMPGSQSMPAMPPAMPGRPGAQSMPAMPPAMPGRPGAQSMPAAPGMPAAPPGPAFRQADEGDEEEGGSSLLLVVALVVIILGLLGVLALNMDALTGGPAPEVAGLDAGDAPVPEATPPAPETPPSSAGGAPAELDPEPENEAGTAAGGAGAGLDDGDPGGEITDAAPPEAEPSTPAAARPAPVARPPKPKAPTGPVTLSIRHRPLKRGEAGSSDLVSVRLDVPGATVLVHHGPPGGPYRELPLREKSGGRYEEWLNFPDQKGSTLTYWITATHPAAPRSASSGSAGAPHTLALE